MCRSASTFPTDLAGRLGWLKTKGALRQEFVIGGFTDPEGSRQGIGALLCGTYVDGAELLFAGKVGTGFSERTVRDLRQRWRRAPAR